MKNKLIRAKNQLMALSIEVLLRINQDNYKIPYWTSSTISDSFNQFTKNSNEDDEYDLVFIINKGDVNWILGAICREIANYFPGKYYFLRAGYYYEGKNVFSYTPNLPPLPRSKAYFFAHYSYFTLCLRMYPELRHSKSFVWYTHPKGIMRDEEFAYVMNHSTKVICMCSQFANRMVNCGVKPGKVTYILGAADPDMFQPHERSGRGAVGFCTAYYPRKEPDRIFNIIKKIPHRKVLLIGRNWEEYERFAELKAIPNFAYIQAPYSDYPKHYSKMDVFVSPAKLEGGPIPLIETMMCNIVPVASNTGFAPDLINHGANGFLFNIDSSAEVICELIEQAFKLKSDIRKTVEHLSWSNFSLEIQKIINLS
ncbi:MAG: glycosyltransferase family 4 protein [Coleofasciculus sp. G1-WW12-02]|uniref:glycosyltransferase family 4 protein n=1 Tax=Coleofasciculus sp. G1-WW12-02 TaxID=3068483 RepID=UPI003301A16A